VSVFFRGLGRPQGIALDRDGNLYVAASYGGRRGIVRITPQAQAEVVLQRFRHCWAWRCSPPAARFLPPPTPFSRSIGDVRGLPLIG